jgi:pimeloyl-ACP methyl ester carboxylesterase
MAGSMRNLFGLAFAALLMARCAGAGTDHTSTMTNAKSHFANCGTNKVHYLTIGKGDHVIVFVHGWACNGNFWREQVGTLADKAKIMLVDLPGHGLSDKPEVDYTMDFFAQSLIAVLNDANVKQATLVGHSMGTPIICRVYAWAPEKVAGLVAVDGVLRRPKRQPEQAERFISRFKGPDYRDNVKRFVESMFPNPGTEAVRDWVLADMLKTPQHVMSSAMDAMFGSKEPDWDPLKVNAPLIVINAKNPMWTDEYEKYARNLSEKVEYQTIENAGHFLMLERPVEFNMSLSTALAKYDLVH